MSQEELVVHSATGKAAMRALFDDTSDCIGYFLRTHPELLELIKYDNPRPHRQSEEEYNNDIDRRVVSRICNGRSRIQTLWATDSTGAIRAALRLELGSPKSGLVHLELFFAPTPDDSCSDRERQTRLAEQDFLQKTLLDLRHHHGKRRAKVSLAVRNEHFFAAAGFTRLLTQLHLHYPVDHPLHIVEMHRALLLWDLHRHLRPLVLLVALVRAGRAVAHPWSKKPKNCGGGGLGVIRHVVEMAGAAVPGDFGWRFFRVMCRCL